MAPMLVAYYSDPGLVAAVMAPPLTDPDLDAAEDPLIGAATRRPFGSDALWTSAEAAAGALRRVA